LIKTILLTIVELENHS